MAKRKEPKPRTTLTGEEYNRREANRLRAKLAKMAKQAMDRALYGEDNGPYLTPAGRIGGPFSINTPNADQAQPGTVTFSQDLPGYAWMKGNDGGWLQVNPGSVIQAGDGLSEADKARIDAIIKEANGAATEAEEIVAKNKEAKQPPIKKSKYGRLIDLKKEAE